MRHVARCVPVAALALTAGTGGLVAFSSAALASSRVSSSSSACTQLAVTLAALQKASSNPAALAAQIPTYVSQLETDSASATPAVKAAVTTFVTDLKGAASGKASISQLTAAAGAIETSCAASAVPASGSAATGSGSTAGLQDGSLILVGSAAMLAGTGALVVARRRRAGLAS